MNEQINATNKTSITSFEIKYKVTHTKLKHSSLLRKLTTVVVLQATARISLYPKTYTTEKHNDGTENVHAYSTGSLY